jgi:putative flippase GtrA
MLASIVTNPRERTRFVRFAVVGVIGAVVDFGTFNLLSSIFDVPVVLASICSFIAAIVSNFTWNRFWTYPDSRSKAVSRQLIEFSVVSMVGLLIRTPIIALLEQPLAIGFQQLAFLPIGFLSAEFLGNNTALASAVLVVMFWNFFINRYWTYSDVE